MKKISFFLLFMLMVFCIKAQSFEIAQDSCSIDSALAVAGTDDMECTIYWNDSVNAISYNLALVDAFDPCTGQTPEDGVLTIMTTVQGTNSPQNSTQGSLQNRQWQHSYTFQGFGGLAEGYYAFAIRKTCDTLGDEGNWFFTNVVTHLMTITYGLQIFYQNGVPPDSVFVTLDGGNCANNYFYQQESNTGNIGFQDISKGTYQRTITIPGIYSGYNNITLLEDTYETIYLQITSISSKKSNSVIFKLFPNPAKSFTTIYSDKKIRQVNIYNPLGQQIFTKTKIDVKQLNISTLGFTSGIYIVKVKTDSKTSVKKLFIQ